MTKQYVISFCYRKYSVQYELSGKKATSSGTSWSKNVTFHQIQLQECSKIWPCCWGSFRRVWIISHYSRSVFTPSSTRVTLLLHISPFVLNIIDGNRVWRQTWSVSSKQLSDSQTGQGWYDLMRYTQTDNINIMEHLILPSII